MCVCTVAMCLLTQFKVGPTVRTAWQVITAIQNLFVLNNCEQQYKMKIWETTITRAENSGKTIMCTAASKHTSGEKNANEKKQESREYDWKTLNSEWWECERRGAYLQIVNYTIYLYKCTYVVWILFMRVYKLYLYVYDLCIFIIMLNIYNAAHCCLLCLPYNKNKNNNTFIMITWSREVKRHRERERKKSIENAVAIFKWIGSHWRGKHQKY